jgi:hypothetical protein
MGLSSAAMKAKRLKSPETQLRNQHQLEAEAQRGELLATQLKQRIDGRSNANSNTGSNSGRGNADSGNADNDMVHPREVGGKKEATYREEEEEEDGRHNHHEHVVKRLTREEVELLKQKE